jgi:hypothetical protein
MVFKVDGLPSTFYKRRVKTNCSLSAKLSSIKKEENISQKYYITTAMP